MTLNMQCLSKTEERSLAANDMVIKRFAPPVHRIISLLPADVGRPITHFASKLLLGIKDVTPA